MRTLLTHRTPRLKGKGKSRTRQGQHVSEEKAKKRRNLLFCSEEQKLVDFLHDNEILYKHLIGYKDRSNRENVWDKFCEEKYMDKDACQRWFQSQYTLFRKVTHMKLGQGEPQLTEKQNWTRDNFDFLKDHIVRHLTAKSEFRVPRGSASQATAAAHSASRLETVHMEPFQDNSRPESTDDPADLSNLNTQITLTPRSCCVSV